MGRKAREFLQSIATNVEESEAESLRRFEALSAWMAAHLIGTELRTEGEGEELKLILELRSMITGGTLEVFELGFMRSMPAPGISAIRSN